MSAKAPDFLQNFIHSLGKIEIAITLEKVKELNNSTQNKTVLIAKTNYTKCQKGKTQAARGY